MRRSSALSAYLMASRLAGPVAWPLLQMRKARGKEDPGRLDERLGRADRQRPEGRLIWLHGASVGEAKSMLPLIAALQMQSDAAILVTTGTVSSARQIGPALPCGASHQYVPVDTNAAVSPFLDHWRPDLAIWVESEFWPRLIEATAHRKVPMALVNARVSAKSTKRWQRAPDMASILLSRFNMILAQDDETRHRLSAFGVNARFGGNLKALVDAPSCQLDQLQAMQAATQGRPVWLAASTHPGEEELVLDAQTHVQERLPEALLILAPRHPERGDDLCRMMEERGINHARHSTKAMPGPETEVVLADTMGEMGLWYQLAPVTFVGGSLVPMGGHTPFEPASLQTAILHGPHVDNFAPAYAAFGAAGGSRAIEGADDLGDAVVRLLSSVAEHRDMTRAATAAHDGLKPDVDGIAAELLILMEQGR
ncbi:MAG: 3-deoxy-D-manno-octulosonic acid transferase [Pseudomonadota bacterium]